MSRQLHQPHHQQQPSSYTACLRLCSLLQSGRDYRYANPPLRVRPASDQEGAAYLAQPVFSSCTVPVLWYPLWLANVAHFFRGVWICSCQC